MKGRWSVIVPALNEAARIGELVATLRGEAPVGEVIVVDGGSADATAAVAARAGARVLTAPRGRGHQLRAGVAASRGAFLWFLHADSRLPAAIPWDRMTRLARAGHLGAFRFAVAGRRPALRLVELGVRLRVALTKLVYGDQGLFCSRATYERLGGFPPWPLMEDIALVDRARAVGVPITVLATPLATDPRRWERDGVWRRTLRNWRLLWRYRRGEDPERLLAAYPPPEARE